MLQKNVIGIVMGENPVIQVVGIEFVSKSINEQVIFVTLEEHFRKA